MPTLKRILVATDFSDCSRAAYREALGLATCFGATLELVNIWTMPYLGPDYGYDSVIVDPVAGAPLFDVVGKAAATAMAAFVASVPASLGVTVKTRIESGDAARRVIEIAEEDGADLVVVGTHGRTGAARWLLGSTSEKIVRHSPCPVLTVPMSEPQKAKS